MRTKRRQILKAGLGTGALFLPLPYAWVWAQSEGAVKLLRAPKQALVIGNGKYKDAPELKNPANDAKAISEALKASGFAVTMKLDTGREEMLAAIRDYVHLMEQKKHVGLFYFAGHGVQLAWRNYLLPVDAVIDKIDDVAKQSIDIARLMEGLTKATNPMNVIILDACRENPFGGLKGADHKGLSQMDAPGQTMLAYATSPGNVASDGEGVNGLYTENLLREIKVPEAKIEDVFKRVRLGVRRKTNGAQIPWESTSLEEDFWFLPPKELKKLSEAEKDNLLKTETELWERIKESKEPGPLEDYLRRYPSGEYSELAQAMLNAVLARQGEKKIHIASSEGNPYTKGSAEFNTDRKVGEVITTRITDIFTKIVRQPPPSTVTQITESQVIYSSGLITDLLGNVHRFPDGRQSVGGQNVPLEFSVGKHWVSRSLSTNRDGQKFDVQIDFKIVARESITVPIGTFNAFRIEGRGNALASRFTVEINNKQWWVPDRFPVPVAREDRRRWPSGGVAELYELVDYKRP